MTNHDDSFIREVNEEIRSERMQVFWRSYGRIVIGLAVLIVVATAGTRIYHYWQGIEASKSGDRFLTALNLIRDKKQDEALGALADLEKDGFGAYPVLARMRAATLLGEKGDVPGAIAAFTAIGNDTSVPAAIRDTAKLRAAYLLVDTGTYDQVSTEVAALAVAGNSLRHSAREVLGLSAYKAGDLAKAQEWFKQIADDAESPRNVANRAQMLLDLIAGTGKLS